MRFHWIASGPSWNLSFGFIFKFLKNSFYCYLFPDPWRMKRDAEDASDSFDFFATSLLWLYHDLHTWYLGLETNYIFQISLGSNRIRWWKIALSWIWLYFFHLLLVWWGQCSKKSVGCCNVTMECPPQTYVGMTKTILWILSWGKLRYQSYFINTLGLGEGFN